MNNHYVCIGYRDLAEGQPVLAYGVHVLSWDFERMGEPRYAFVPAEEIDGDAAELLAVRNEKLHGENAALTERIKLEEAERYRWIAEWEKMAGRLQARLQAAEAVCEVIKTFRDNGEFFDPDTCRALDEWQKARDQ